jgi:hypothetical protein
MRHAPSLALPSLCCFFITLILNCKACCTCFSALSLSHIHASSSVHCRRQREMRLLETIDGRSYNLTGYYFHENRIPPYAILSHTWEDNQEITFDDMNQERRSKHKRWRASVRMLPRKLGYDKLRFCAKQANRDGLQYFWVDTCCINKSDPQELETAINSMSTCLMSLWIAEVGAPRIPPGSRPS